MTVKAIETSYAGSRFRSRLEARWAAFFDLLEWRWTYEPFAGNHYIPDFLIHGPEPLLIEVKPAATTKDMERHIPKITEGLRGRWEHDVLIVGLDPVIGQGMSWYPSLDVAGLLGEYFLEDNDPVWVFAEGVWSECPGSETSTGYGGCGEIGVQHTDQSFYHRPCGHYPGGSLGSVRRGALPAAWRAAGNTVRWQP